MLQCYTLGEDNLVTKGITVQTDLINKCEYICSKGKLVDKYIKLYETPKRSRVYKGELFYKTFKESNSEVNNVVGTLVCINWKTRINGGELYTNIVECIEEGSIEVVSTSRRYEGLSLDFNRELYTTTYLVKINKECDVDFSNIVMLGKGEGYYTSDRFRITFNPTKEPRVTRIL